MEIVLELILISFPAFQSLKEHKKKKSKFRGRLVDENILLASNFIRIT